MTNEELMKEVKRLFGSKRILLLEALRTYADKLPVRIAIANSLREQTGCHVRSFDGLSNAALEWLDKESSDIKNLGFDPEDRSNLIGDPSIGFSILLNKNIKDPLDFDVDLAEKHRRLLFCDVLVSLIVPFYTYDIYYWDYSKKDNCQEWGPHIATKKQELKIIDSAKKVMKDFGYKKISKQIAQTCVKHAITDCLSKGNASVYNCIFEDIFGYTETIFRTNIESVNFPELSAVGNWRERYDKNGKLADKEIYLQFLNNDDITAVINSRGSIKQFKVYSKPHRKKKTQWIAYDTNEKTGHLVKIPSKHMGMVRMK